MTVTERTTIVGSVLGLITFIAYWTVIIVRALTDDVPFVDVEWQGPMLAAILVGGALYAISYGLISWQARGTRRSDERDYEIQRYAESAGAGLAGLGSLAALIMLTLDVDTFWVATTLFTLGYLGSLVNSGVTIAAYQQGMP